MLFALALAAGLVAPNVPCGSLVGLSLPDTKIVSAALVPPGPFTPPAPPGNTPVQPPRPINVPASCRVIGRVNPAITFEVWMPIENWNGKFQGVGGGGFAGAVSYGAIGTALNRGYAAASTDTGHSGPGGQWALGHPELVTDYGYRAIHEMTVQSKAIVKAFYGDGPRRSYFTGCSTGGRQGLMEAQRFPADYDGIVATAPVNFFTHLMVGTLWVAHATLKDPATAIPAAKFGMLNKAVLAACDARDGVADGLLEDPTRCDFDPVALQCVGADSETCLTPPQVEAVRKIYAAVKNPRTGEELFPGMPRGGETTWTAMAGGPNPFRIPVDVFKYFVYDDPTWDWRRLDFDKDVAAIDRKLASDLNATNVNLAPFKARGGKLILSHGWNDQLVQPLNTINYYRSVQKEMGARSADEFVRVYMVPGMLHCGGGPGPNTYDAIGALERWVEQGTAPASLLATHSTDGVVDRARPLCPYPQVAVYKGTGSINDAGSFVCR